MKILTCIVVCVSVANAFPMMSDELDSSCYEYTCSFPSEWCEAEYYDSILEVYPGDTCQNEDWTETDVEVIISRLENALEEYSNSMRQEMNEQRDVWLCQVDDNDEQCKASYRQSITLYYEDLGDGVVYTVEAEAKINSYNSKIDVSRQEALDSYNADISKNMITIGDYHAELVNNSRNCLTTRLQKIAEYKEETIQTVYDAIVQFTRLHLNVIDQRKAKYESSLTKLFGADSDIFTSVKAAISIQEYYARQRTNVERLARKYAFQMTEYYKQALINYACAYKCYMSNSCTFGGFYDDYCTSTNSMEIETDYSISQYSISPFSYVYSYSRDYDSLTCDIAEEQTNAENIISNLRSELQQTLVEERDKFDCWLCTWEQNNVEYMAEYERVAIQNNEEQVEKARLIYIQSDGEITFEHQTELDNLEIQLEEELPSICSSYNSELDEKLGNAQAEHLSGLSAFEISITNFIDGLESDYNDCVAERTRELGEYSDLLVNQRDQARLDLVADINQAKDKHIGKFEQMLISYHGADYMSYSDVSDMYHCYVEVIGEQVEEVLSNFDSYWTTTIPILLKKFECNHRCIIKNCTIESYECESCYSWTYQLPTCVEAQYS